MYSTSDLQIRPSHIHGLGVFALRAIPARTKVLEYLGKRLTKGEYDNLPDKTYAFEIYGEFVLDGAGTKWNPAGFINHSCEPNCEPWFVENSLWIATLRDIKPEEELSFNYGYDVKDVRKNPCRCGAANCVGFMVAEEFFPEVRRLRESGELSA